MSHILRLDRNSEPIVPDNESLSGIELDIDPGRVARDRLVHRVVEYLGSEMMPRGFVRPANVHAGTTAYRLEALQDFDIAAENRPSCRLFWPSPYSSSPSST